MQCTESTSGRLINTDLNVKVSYTMTFFSKIMKSPVSSTRGQSDINSETLAKTKKRQQK